MQVPDFEIAILGRYFNPFELSTDTSIEQIPFIRLYKKDSFTPASDRASVDGEGLEERTPYDVRDDDWMLSWVEDDGVTQPYRAAWGLYTWSSEDVTAVLDGCAMLFVVGHDVDGAGHAMECIGPWVVESKEYPGIVFHQDDETGPGMIHAMVREANFRLEAEPYRKEPERFLRKHTVPDHEARTRQLILSLRGLIQHHLKYTIEIDQWTWNTTPPNEDDSIAPPTMRTTQLPDSFLSTLISVAPPSLRTTQLPDSFLSTLISVAPPSLRTAQLPDSFLSTLTSVLESRSATLRDCADASAEQNDNVNRPPILEQTEQPQGSALSHRSSDLQSRPQPGNALGIDTWSQTPTYSSSRTAEAPRSTSHAALGPRVAQRAAPPPPERSQAQQLPPNSILRPPADIIEAHTGSVSRPAAPDAADASRAPVVIAKYKSKRSKNKGGIGHSAEISYPITPHANAEGHDGLVSPFKHPRAAPSIPTGPGQLSLAPLPLINNSPIMSPNAPFSPSDNPSFGRFELSSDHLPKSKLKKRYSFSPEWYSRPSSSSPGDASSPVDAQRHPGASQYAPSAEQSSEGLSRAGSPPAIEQTPEQLAAPASWPAPHNVPLSEEQHTYRPHPREALPLGVQTAPRLSQNPPSRAPPFAYDNRAVELNEKLNRIETKHSPERSIDPFGHNSQQVKKPKARSSVQSGSESILNWGQQLQAGFVQRPATTKAQPQASAALGPVSTAPPVVTTAQDGTPNTSSGVSSDRFGYSSMLTPLSEPASPPAAPRIPPVTPGSTDADVRRTERAGETPVSRSRRLVDGTSSNSSYNAEERGFAVPAQTLMAAASRLAPATFPQHTAARAISRPSAPVTRTGEGVPEHLQPLPRPSGFKHLLRTSAITAPLRRIRIGFVQDAIPRFYGGLAAAGWIDNGSGQAVATAARGPSRHRSDIPSTNSTYGCDWAGRDRPYHPPHSPNAECCSHGPQDGDAASHSGSAHAQTHLDPGMATAAERPALPLTRTSSGVIPTAVGSSNAPSGTQDPLGRSHMSTGRASTPPAAATRTSLTHGSPAHSTGPGIRIHERPLQVAVRRTAFAHPTSTSAHSSCAESQTHEGSTQSATRGTSKAALTPSRDSPAPLQPGSRDPKALLRRQDVQPVAANDVPFPDTSVRDQQQTQKTPKRVKKYRGITTPSGWWRHGATNEQPIMQVEMQNLSPGAQRQLTEWDLLEREQTRTRRVDPSIKAGRFCGLF